MDHAVTYEDLLARLREIGLTEDPELLVETTQLFLNDAAQMVEAMKSSFAKGDATGLFRAAHRLKGAALNLGATAVATSARTIEEGARRGELVDVASAVKSIEGDLNGVAVFMRGLAKTGSRA